METEEIIIGTLIVVSIAIFIFALFIGYRQGKLLGFFKLFGSIALISGISYLIYYISTYITNKDNSSFLRSVFGLSIIILVAFLMLILSTMNLKPYIDGLLSFFGLNDFSDSYLTKCIVILIGLLLVVNIYLTGDLNFNISNSSPIQLSFPVALFSGIIILLFSFSMLGIFDLNMVNSNIKLMLFPLLLITSLFTLFESTKGSPNVNKGKEISFMLSIVSFLLYGLSLYFNNSDTIQTIYAGTIFAAIIMIIPLLNDFVLEFAPFNKYLFYIFSGVVALIVFLLLSGKLFTTNSFHSVSNIKESLRMDSGFSNSVIFYLILLLLIPVLGNRFLTIEKEEGKASDDIEILKDVSIYVFPIILIMLFGTNIFSSNNSGTMVLLYSIVTLSLLFGYLYLLTIISDDQKDLLNYFSGLLIILSIVLLLAMIFLLTANHMGSLDGVPGIIAYLIFYIPCLVIDFINYIKKELSLITPTLGIIFILEIIVILCYLYLPKLLNKMTKLSGVDVVKEPITLNDEVKLPAGKMFLIPPKNVHNKDEQLLQSGINNQERPRYNYAVSMWVYVNTNANNSNAYANELNIFNYDDKPSVSYKINVSGCKNKPTEIDTDSDNLVYKYINNTKDGCNPDEINLDNIGGNLSNFIFRFTNEPDSEDNINTVKIELPSQKWHFFVFNYNNNIADLFVNGNLFNSYKFSDNNRPTYDHLSDELTIGEKNGLEGVICNTVYHTKPLTKFEIANTYNLLMNYNPPINNL